MAADRPPAFVGRAQPGPYRSLNPATKLVIAVAEAIIAFGIRGWTGPLVVLGILIVTGTRARVGRSFVPFLVATIPLIASILLINTLLYPGATDRIFSAGPIAPTWTGLTAATQAALRVIAFAMSVALLGLTTSADDLVDDLERRGLGRRSVFVVGATIRAVPRMVVRAGEIIDAQRSRGLDTEGRIWRRLRGILPLAGPMLVGALGDVEAQSVALEARGFTAPGRRTVLHSSPDSGGQRALRWSIGLVTAAALVASITGSLGLLP